MYFVVISITKFPSCLVLQTTIISAQRYDWPPASPNLHPPIPRINMSGEALLPSKAPTQFVLPEAAPLCGTEALQCSSRTQRRVKNGP